MSHGCDWVKTKTLSKKFTKFECIWCGAKITRKKDAGAPESCHHPIMAEMKRKELTHAH